MSGYEILIVILAILSFSFFLDRILVFLNIRSMKGKLPAQLSDLYSEEKFQQSQQYNREKAWFGNIIATLQFGVVITILALGLLGRLDDFLRQYIADQTLLSLAFLGILFLVSDLITLPFSWYGTFVIEEKYGFNKTRPGTFITDRLKSYGLALIFGGAILYLFLFLVNELQEGFWIWAWVLISALSLGMAFLYGTLIIPLFNKLRPLEEGQLRDAIQEYCDKVEFPMQNIFIIDGSKRSTKSNAFFMGFGRLKKVVFYDTLVEQFSVEELVAIFAHEVGHYKRKHILSSFLAGILQTGLMLYLFSLMIFSPTLSLALGATTPSLHLNLLAAALLYSPVSQLIGFLTQYISRRNEYQADHYALKTFGGEPLGSALKKLSKQHLSNPVPHPAFVAAHYSHPTLLQRLERLTKSQG